MRIYLDTCCYNRRFDENIPDELIQEKLAMYKILKYIVKKKINLVTSFMLHYEILQIKIDKQRESINLFIKNNRKIYIGVEFIEILNKKVDKIIKSGIKHKDAYHLASAIFTECDYFVTFDKKLLKFKSDEISTINPVDFVKILEVDENAGRL